MTVIARRVPCRSCDQTVIVARCFDGHWRAFETTWQTGDLYQEYQRWWLTKSRGMVNASMASRQPERWLLQHYCETGIASLPELLPAMRGAS